MRFRFGHRPGFLATTLMVASSCFGWAALGGTPTSIDPAEFFRSLVDRYRTLTEYQDSVKLEQRTVERSSSVQSAPVASAIDCSVRNDRLALRTSDLRAETMRSALPWTSECDARDGSPLGRMRLASQLWLLPHLSLRFAEEPLRSMQGAGGTLVPMTVETVTVGEKSLVRLHLVSRHDDAPSGGAASSRDATVDLFVNPRSMLVERIEHSRELAEGVRYEATIEISPERAVAAPTGVSPAEDTTPQEPAPKEGTSPEPRRPNLGPAEPTDHPGERPADDPAGNGTRPSNPASPSDPAPPSPREPSRPAPFVLPTTAA
ncbi:MAG: hypothetical protein U0572_02065 [Phycisphaerales bacterium]